MPADVEPARPSRYGRYDQIHRRVRLHCGEGIDRASEQQQAWCRRDPQKLCRHPSPPGTHHSPEMFAFDLCSENGTQRLAPGRRELIHWTTPPHPCVHLERPPKVPRRSAHLPCLSRKQIRNIPTREGSSCGLGPAYPFLSSEMPHGCWNCSRHCSKHTVTLRGKLFHPLGFSPGRRSFWTSENTGRAPGSHSWSWCCCWGTQQREAHTF